MSSLELAHQCLMVWNTLIAFRKLDMSRYMEDTNCLFRKHDFSVWFRALTAVPGLSLLPGAPLTGAPAPGRPPLPVREGAPVHAVVLLRATGLCRALPGGAYVWVTALGGSLDTHRLAPMLRFSVDLPEGVRGPGGLELYIDRYS